MWVQLRVVILTGLLTAYRYVTAQLAWHLLPPATIEATPLLEAAIREDTNKCPPAEVDWLLLIINQEPFLE